MRRIASIRHRNMRPILEFGLIDERSAWSITPLPAGTPVSQQLSHRGAPPIRAALELLFCVASALETAHSMGTYHGHLSANEIVWESGQVVVDGWGEIWQPEMGLERDLSAMRQLAIALTPSSDPQFSEIVSSEVGSAGEYRRILAGLLDESAQSAKPLLPSQGPPANTPDVDETTDTPMLLDGLFEDTSSVAEVERSSSTEMVDPQEQTGDHNWDSIALQESWGIGLPTDNRPEPLDAAPVHTSSGHDPVNEEDWGLGETAIGSAPTGIMERGASTEPQIHRVITRTEPRPSVDVTKKSSGKLPILAAICLLLACGLFVAKIMENDTPSEPATTNDPEPVALPTVKPDTVKAPPARPVEVKQPMVVTVSFVPPVPVTVTRLSDGTSVCREQSTCPLPIDVDYVARHPDFMDHTISGDDLYDLRGVGKMRRVLRKKPTKARRR